MNWNKKTIIMCVMFAFIFALTLGVGPVMADVSDTIFELDGNAMDLALGDMPDDWQTLYNAGGSFIEFTSIISDPHPKTIFTTGGSKDIHNISKWRYKDGSVPDKDDIANAYAAAYKNVSGDLVLYFGADRYANDGDAQLGFWFFQDIVGPVGGGVFSGSHKIGDILVLVKFEKGGEVPTIQVLEWVGSGGDQKQGTLNLMASSTDALCGSPAADPRFCAITNFFPETSPWNYTPKSGDAGMFPPQSFFEGGINISEIFNGQAIPCFTSFLAETRASSEVTATLKDFVWGKFEICKIEAKKDCFAVKLNGTGDAYIYSWKIAATNTGFGDVTDVEAIDDRGTPGNKDDDIKVYIDDLLEVDEKTWSDEYTTETTLTPYENTAVVTAWTGATSISATSKDMCPSMQLNPDIATSKYCKTIVTKLDGKIAVMVEFWGTVTNTGLVKLKNVRAENFIDLPVPNSDITVPIALTFPEGNDRGVLLPGETATFGSPMPLTYYPHPSLLEGDLATDQSFQDRVTGYGTPALPAGADEIFDVGSDTCPLCVCPNG